MRAPRGFAVLFLACLPAALAWSPPAAAQPARPAAALSAAQAERNAVELKQGMSAEEVERLLGKPRRTQLKANGWSSSGQGSLQWTYSWRGAPASSPGNLNVVFTASGPEKWQVSSWEWSTY